MIKISLKFIISDKYDLEEFYNLWREHKNLRTVLKNFIIKNWPDFDVGSFPPPKKTLEILLTEKYAKEKLQMKRDVGITKKDWNKVEAKFYQLVNDVFKSMRLEGEYDVYPSVWPFFIRNFNAKRISVPYNKGNSQESLFVLAHELLHVIFYAYLDKKFSGLIKNLESKKVWDFSEVINVIIQSQDSWVKVFGLKGYCYSEHKKLFLLMLNEWGKHKDLDKMIKKFLC